MKKIEFIYSSGVMGDCGEGYLWHKLYKFPKLPYTTKTVTLKPIKGFKYTLLPDPIFTKSVWNKVGLKNIGFYNLLKILKTKSFKDRNDIIVSIAGNTQEIDWMCNILPNFYQYLKGVELNYSCPNYKSFHNTHIPFNFFAIPIYLKLNCNMDLEFIKKHFASPCKYNRIHRITINSVPVGFGAISGKAAQAKNWEFVNKLVDIFGKEKILIPSCINEKDRLQFYNNGKLEYAGFSIGSSVLINPKEVEKLIHII